MEAFCPNCPIEQWIPIWRWRLWLGRDCRYPGVLRGHSLTRLKNLEFPSRVWVMKERKGDGGRCDINRFFESFNDKIRYFPMKKLCESLSIISCKCTLYLAESVLQCTRHKHYSSTESRVPSVSLSLISSQSTSKYSSYSGSKRVVIYSGCESSSATES